MKEAVSRQLSAVSHSIVARFLFFALSVLSGLRSLLSG
jgi:hypothetical protein